MQLFRDRLQGNTTLEELLVLLSDAHEYSELPVRHNEDLLNGELAKNCRLPVNMYSLDSSHTKTHLLLQAHFSRLSLPCADYITDTKSVLDQAIRILQSMIDVAAESGWLATTLRIQQLLQMVIQAVWIDDPSVLILPHMNTYILPVLLQELLYLPVLQQRFNHDPAYFSQVFRNDLDPDQIREMGQVLTNLPIVNLGLSLRWAEKSIPLQAKDIEWIDVPADQECLMDVTFSRPSSFNTPNPAAAAAASGGARPKRPASSGPPPGLPAQSNSRMNRAAYAPKFPKSKDEGWFLTLGLPDNAELLAIKRVTLPRARCSHQMGFRTPVKPGRIVLNLYFMSDSYVGLDQQYSVHLNVTPAIPEEYED